MIMTDDQGAWSRGRLMPELVTPALDELGATGRELTSFFCASPVCSPARASVLTGRMPSAHGVHDWIRCENSGIDTAGVRYLAGLDTTPQILAENGWTCAHSGKWHLGDARNPAPGFTGWFAHRDGGGPYYGAPVVTDGIEGTEPGYVTDAITAHAVALLTGLTSTDDPFYLQVHYTAPHAPWTPANHPDELPISTPARPSPPCRGNRRTRGSTPATVLWPAGGTIRSPPCVATVPHCLGSTAGWPRSSPPSTGPAGARTPT